MGSDLGLALGLGVVGRFGVWGWVWVECGYVSVWLGFRVGFRVEFEAGWLQVLLGLDWAWSRFRFGLNLG